MVGGQSKGDLFADKRSWLKEESIVCVLHELLNFKYANHDADFYAFLTSLMPDWKQRKDILDEEIVMNL
jgi:predicted metal-dependent hydrolase